eukprot:6172017-Pleurochrysis_carterae.AAC.2
MAQFRDIAHIMAEAIQVRGEGHFKGLVRFFARQLVSTDCLCSAADILFLVGERPLPCRGSLMGLSLYHTAQNAVVISRTLLACCRLGHTHHA